MTDDRYPLEQLDPNEEDDGTMPANVATLAEHVVGHRIISAEKGTARVASANPYNGKIEAHDATGLVITLDNGEKVVMEDESDCCAYTSLEKFLLHPDLVDHLITGVGTTDRYQTWHIYADMGDVLELTVGWSAGNPFYYGYGFTINVTPLEGEVIDDDRPALPAAENR